MVSLYMFHKIRELNKKGYNKSEIAKELGIHRQTVARYLNLSAPPSYTDRDSATRCDPFMGFKERVKGWLSKNIYLSGVEVFELLVDEGYKGSLRTVKRRVQKIKDLAAKERFFEQKYEPGEQSQFDFKERIKIPFKDGDRELYLHFGTLPFSDRFFISAYPGKNYECFIEGVHRFFDVIGGITKNIRIDNLSPCVSKVYKGQHRKYTSAFQDAIEYYGFGVLPCNPGKGSDKGDVERDIQTHSRRILNLIRLKDLRFNDFYDLNFWLVEYCKKRNSETIIQKYNEEIPSLYPLLERNEEILCRNEERMASAYGMIKHNDTNYSVPDYAIGKKCKIVLSVNKVILQLADENRVIAVHPRGKGDSILLEHVIPSLVRKPQAMVRWAHKEALFPSKVYKKLYSRLKSIASFRAEQDYLKILNLIQNVKFEDLTLAIELALEDKNLDLFNSIRCLLFVEHRPENIVNISQNLNQHKLNVKLENYNLLIPGEKNGSPRTHPMSKRTKTKCDEARILQFSSARGQGK